MGNGLLKMEPPPNEAGRAELDDFDTLVRLYRPLIFRFLLASLRDREAAENLTQDCFVRAFQARAQFRGEASVRTWLMQIAANLARSHRGNSRLRFWKRALEDGMDVGALGDFVPDRGRSPEAQAQAREEVQAIWSAAASLPEKQRTVFLLRFVEEMELSEIAAITGLAEGTVKTHLFRALEAVRARLEKRR